MLLEDITVEQWGGGRHQPDWLLPLRRGIPGDEGAESARWSHHQQRLISAYAPRPNVFATSTKHAITGLTKTTRLICRKYDIACRLIDIGNAVTEMTADA